MARFQQAAVAMVTFFMIAACNDNGAKPSSESEAGEVVEDFMNRSARKCFPLGELHILRKGGGAWHEGRISASDWAAIFEPAAEAGFLRIDDVKDLTAGFSGWGDWAKLTQSDVAKVALVSAGPRAGELGSPVEKEFSKPAGRKCIEWVEETFEVEDVVDLRRIDHPGEELILVQGLYSARPELVSREIGRAPRVGKFRALLRLNVFEGEWEMLTLEFKPPEQNFPVFEDLP
jgi:hypothetical protein